MKSTAIPLIAMILTFGIVKGEDRDLCFAGSYIASLHCKIARFGRKEEHHGHGLEVLFPPIMQVLHGQKTLDDVHNEWHNKGVVGLHEANDKSDFIGEVAERLLKLTIVENRLVKAGLYRRPRQGRGLLSSAVTVLTAVNGASDAIADLPKVIEGFKNGNLSPLQDESKYYQPFTVNRTIVDDISDVFETCNVLLIKAGVPGTSIWEHAADVFRSIAHLFGK